MAAMASSQLRLPTSGRQQPRLVARASVEPQAQSRRTAFTILTSVAVGLLATREAEAKMGNGSKASQSGYDMEGLKKKKLSPDRRQEVLAKVKPKEAKGGIETGGGKNQAFPGEKLLGK